MKRTGFTEVLLVLLTVIVLLAVFTVGLAMVYPKAAKNIVADVSQSFESRKGGGFGLVRGIIKRGEEGLNARIVPAIQWISDSLADLLSRKKRQTIVAEKKAGPSIEAGDCMTAKCHPKLFEQKAFAGIYLDHRLHDAAGISCSQCHADTKHPKPRRVEESTCIDCHKDVRVAADCAGCHAPGSILSDQVIPEEKTKEFLKGRLASAKSLMQQDFGAPHTEWLKGQGDVPCLDCHESTSFCDKCHLVFHDKISDWPMIHGPKLMRQEYVMNACWGCHNARWCAGNCHVNAGLQRSRGYLDIPRVPLEVD